MSSFREVYNVDKYEGLIAQPISVRLNGINMMSLGFSLTEYPNILLPETVNRFHQINFTQGVRNYGGRYNTIPFSLNGQIRALTYRDFERKLDMFKSWLDTLQNKSYEYVIGNISISAMMFELGIHWYTSGTLSGTSGGKFVTGVGTTWTKTVSPDARLEILDNSTIYTVTNVVSDTKLEISPALSATIAASTPYRVQRKRYLLVNLDGASSITPISERGFLAHSKLVSSEVQTNMGSNVYDVQVGMVAVYPFWIGDCIDHKETSLASGSFVTLDYAGNSPSNPVYQIVGATNNPKITAGEYTFTSNYDCSLKGAEFTGTEILPTVTAGLSHETGVINEGIDIVGSNNVSFSSMNDASTPSNPYADKFNRNQGSLVIMLKPDFASTSNTDFFIFDDGNSFTIKWDGGNTRFELSDGTLTAFVTFAFSATNNIVLIASWDSKTGADVDTLGNELQIWGGVGTLTTGTPAATYVTGNPGATLYIGSDSLSANAYDGIVDEFAIFETPLTLTDREEIFNSGSPVPSSMVSQSPLTYIPLDDLSLASGVDLGSMREQTLLASETTTTTVTVAAGGDGFEDNEKVILYDSAGYNVGAWVNGNPSSTSITIDDGAAGAVTNADFVGVSVSLDGSLDYLNVSDTGALDITTGDIVGSAWIKTSSSARQTIFAKSNGEGNPGYIFYMDTSGFINFYIEDDLAASDIVTGAIAVNDGYWHNVTALIDRNSTKRIFIDGRADATSASATATSTLSNAVSFTVGAESDGGNKFNGNLRSVRYYAVTIGGSSAYMDGIHQVAGSEQFTTASIPSAETSWWKFNEASTALMGTDSAGSATLVHQGSPTRVQEGVIISTNLIADPNHRNRNMGGYVLGGTDTLWNPRIVTTNSMTDGHAFFVDSTAGAGNIARKQISVERGVSYKIRFRYRFANTDNTDFSIIDTTSVTTYINDPTELRIGTTSDVWENYEVVVDIPNSGALEHILEVTFEGAGGGGNNQYVDNFYVVRNYTTNGGVVGGVTSWQQVGTPTTFATDSDEHTLATSLKVITDALGEGAESNALTLEANEWFEASGFVKGFVASPGRTWTLSLEGFSDAVGTVTRDIVYLTTGGAAHEEIASYDRDGFIFYVKTDTSGTFRIVNQSDTVDTIFLDDWGVIKRKKFNVDAGGASTIPTYKVTCHGKGVEINGGPNIVYSSIIGNPNLLGFVCRFQPLYDSDTAETTDKYLFHHRDDDTAANSFGLYYDVSEDKFTLNIRSGSADNITLVSDVVIFESGNDYEVSGWYDPAGRIDEKTQTTIYGRMLINGEISATLSSTVTAPAVKLNTLNVGSHWDGSTSELFAQSVIDQITLFAYAPTDEELKRIYRKGDPILNDSSTIEVTKVLATDDIMEINTDPLQRGVKVYDASDESESIIQPINTKQKFPSIHPQNEYEKQVLYVSTDGTAIPELHIIYRAHMR